MAQLKINNAAWKFFNNITTNNLPARVWIMQGAIPTASEIYNASSNYASSIRASDILVQWSSTPTGYTGNDNNIVVSEYALRAATGTGVATWAYVTMGDINGNSTSNGYVGDVSDTSPTAFLLMSNTNIIAGESYKIISMQISLAHEFNF